MIRTIHVNEIIDNVKEMCIEANHVLSKDMDYALKCACRNEKSELGKKILGQLQENMRFSLMNAKKAFLFHSFVFNISSTIRLILAASSLHPPIQ